MKTLNIAKNMKLPADMATVTSAVLGIRGSGKTHTATVMVEELLKQDQQVVIIDPTDVWWGLKSSADGKSEGFPILVAGGEHSDVPLERGAPGRVFAGLIVEDRVSVILSLRHLPKSEQRRFVTDFAEEFYHRKGAVKHRSPVLMVIDECDSFVPQRVDAASARMVGAFEDIVRRGRSSGIGVVLISQRPASIHKDVLTQAEMLVCHRVLSPQDRKALEAWIEAHDAEGRHDEFMGSLASLGKGDAWFWSPSVANVFERAKVRHRETFDSSSTPTLSTSKGPAPRLAPVDLERYREKLAAVIEEADANDVRKLRAKIATLECQIAAAKSATSVDEQAVERAIASCRDEFNTKIDGWRQQLADLESTMQNALTALSANVSRIGTVIGRDAVSSIGRFAAALVKPESVRRHSVPAPPVRRASAAKMPAGGVELTKYQLALLEVLVSRTPVPTAKHSLAVQAGYSTKSSAFAPSLRALIAAGLVAETRGGYVATDFAMRQYDGNVSAPRQGREAFEYWISKLPTTEGRMLQGIGARSMTPEVISERTGLSLTSSAFKPTLRNLCQLGLVVKNDTGFHLSPELVH